VSARLIEIAEELGASLTPLSFGPPVTHIYNPYAYAMAPLRAYCERFGQGTKEVVLVGMNPGPWGMAQTGVPFGEVGYVRDWLGIDEPVGKPEAEHPKRPVEGFGCARSEVSGSRVWGWAKARFGTPEAFFARFFVYNYCPLVFMEASGRNRTPVQLKAAERRGLFGPCDGALRLVVEHLGASIVVGVGQFAAERAAASLVGLDVRVGQLLHPSPASPLANKGWATQAEAQLRALGVDLPG